MNPPHNYVLHILKKILNNLYKILNLNLNNKGDT